ncbi:MAG: hypothetical protein DU480_07130 [Nitrosomonas sp.]|uniref:hypothetical protein n=1 Tax=Nitrosomonas sp. TaxID=42353 RepID=UPI0032EF0E29
MFTFDGAGAKLDRACVHMEQLREATREYMATEPFELVQRQQENGDFVVSVRVRNAVPRVWSLIIGDAVHNMRAALDHLVWRLVELGGGLPGRRTCFPVGRRSKVEFERDLPQALAGANSTAIAFIRRLKPYEGGNRVLSRLHALDIADKHRLVLVVGAAYKHFLLSPRLVVPWQPTPVEFPSIAISPADRLYPLSDGAVVFRICAAARGVNPSTDFGATFELAFGEVDEVRGLPLAETLEEMKEHVSRIIQIAENRLAR